MNFNKVLTSAVLLLGAAACGPSGTALAEHQALLEREVLARQVLLSELEAAGTTSAELLGAVDELRRSLSVVNVRSLAAGLHEEGATGRLERFDSGEERIVLAGPGPLAQALSALAIAGERAGGVVLDELEVSERGWKAQCTVAPPPAFAPDTALPPQPVAPAPGLLGRRGSEWEKVTRLEAELARLDGALGADYRSLERARFEYQLLLRHGRQPDRLGRMVPALRRLLGGEAPPLAAAHVRWDHGHGAITGTLAGAQERKSARLEGERFGWHQLVDVKVEGGEFSADLVPAS